MKKIENKSYFNIYYKHHYTMNIDQHNSSYIQTNKDIEFKHFKQNIFKNTFYSIFVSLGLATFLAFVFPRFVINWGLPLIFIDLIGSLISIFLYKRNTYKTEIIEIKKVYIQTAKHTNRNLYSSFFLAFFGGIGLAPVILIADLVDPLILPMALILSIGTFIGACYFGNDNDSLGDWTSALYGLLSEMVLIGLISLITMPFFPEFADMWFSISPYLGILLFFFLTAHDIYVAKREYMNGNLDDLHVSRRLYLDFMNFFVDFVKILIDLKKKEK